MVCTGHRRPRRGSGPGKSPPSARLCFARVEFFFFSSRRRHTRFDCDWSSDVCSSDLIYLKPAFYGRESMDVVNYAKTSPTFPHESTVDQFFNESQFESYRALGSHVIDEILPTAPPPAPQAPDAPPKPSLDWLVRKTSA